MTTATSPNLPEPATCEDCLTVVAWAYVPSAVWKDTVLTDEPGKAELAREMGCDVRELTEYAKAQRAIQLLAAEVERLRAEVAALRAQIPAPPTPPGPTFWFMRDNHTFRKLAGTPEEMVAQCMEEFDAGWTYGGLFAKNLPSKSFGVHASGLAAREDFRVNALAALDASRLALKEAP